MPASVSIVALEAPTSARSNSCGCSRRLSSKVCGIPQDAPSNAAAAYFDTPSAWAYTGRDITEDLRGLLEPPQVRHRPGIIDPGRLAELLRAIDGYTGREVIGIALKLAVLFFVRPGELRKARWQQ
jgi:integrase